MTIIDNKVDLRLECARIALNSGRKDYIEVAKKLEEYILGDAMLPETSNPNELIEKLLSFSKAMSTPTNDFKENQADENELAKTAIKTILH